MQQCMIFGGMANDVALSDGLTKFSSPLMAGNIWAVKINIGKMPMVSLLGHKFAYAGKNSQHISFVYHVGDVLSFAC